MTSSDSTRALSTPAGILPPFSWETPPVYQMFADDRLLSPEEVEAVAATTRFLCIEKAHANATLGSADLGANREIAQFRDPSRETTCLVYLNAAYAYPFVSYSKAFDPSVIHERENAHLKAFLLADRDTGALACREGDGVLYFDVLNPDFRTWWAETVGDFVRKADAEGLFVDQMHGFAWLRPEQTEEVEAAQAEMMRMAKAAIGGDKLLLLNNGAHIPALFAIGDAFMFEHYGRELLSKEAIVEDWALMKKISDAGKACVWRIGVEQDDLTHAKIARDESITPAFLEALSRERINYYLAAFLIGAQENAYFQYGWGWKLKTGPLCGYPELQKPLGSPQGHYTRIDPDGWVFERAFEHAHVTVDLAEQTGDIQWRA